MKEFKGTPGKWIVKLQNGRNSHDIIVDREDYAWVASVNQQFHDVATPEQAEANAKLIAAAPELLDALKELLKFCKSHNMDNYYTGSAEGIIDRVLS